MKNPFAYWIVNGAAAGMLIGILQHLLITGISWGIATGIIIALIKAQPVKRRVD